MFLPSILKFQTSFGICSFCLGRGAWWWSFSADLLETKSLSFCLSKKICLCFLKYFIFNWNIIPLQCCIGFCHISTRVSHRYTHIASLLRLPPTPLGHRGAPSWAPCVICQLPAGSLVYTWVCMCQCYSPNSSLPSQPALSDSLASYTEGRTKWDFKWWLLISTEEPTPVKNLDSAPWIPQSSVYCINL